MGCSWLSHLTADITFMWQGHLLKLRRHFVLGPRPAALLFFFFLPPHPSLPLAKTRADSEWWFATLWNEQINLQHWAFLDYLPSAALFCNTLTGRGVKHKAWKLETPECWCLKKAWQRNNNSRNENWHLLFVLLLLFVGTSMSLYECATCVQSPKKPQEGSRYSRD